MDFSLTSLWAAMGPFARGIVVTLLLMSLVSLVVAFERVFAFVTAGGLSKRFAEALAKQLADSDVAKVAAEVEARRRLSRRGAARRAEGLSHGAR